MLVLRDYSLVILIGQGSLNEAQRRLRSYTGYAYPDSHSSRKYPWCADGRAAVSM